MKHYKSRRLLVFGGGCRARSFRANFSNPFNLETVINYRIDQTAQMRVAIYDIKGQLIKTLVQERQPPGFYSFKWEGTDALGNEVASGTYLYRLEVGEFIQVKKLTLLR